MKAKHLVFIGVLAVILYPSVVQAVGSDGEMRSGQPAYISAALDEANASRDSLLIRLRFIAGFSQQERAKVVTSYYLKPFFSGSILTDFKVEREIEELKSVFHLNEVRLLDEADLAWAASAGASVFYKIMLMGNEYTVEIKPSPRRTDALFGVEISEKKDGSARQLLSTQLILPYAQAAVLGFQDSEKKPYFVSFHVEGGVAEGVAAGVSGGVEGGVEGGVSGGVSGGVEGGLEGIKAKEISAKQVPRLLKKIDPALPLWPGVSNKDSGAAVVEIQIDEAGKVMVVRILSGTGHPLTDQSVVAAVKRWLYEPYREDGKPVPVRFQAVVNYSFADRSRAEGFTAGDAEADFPEKEIPLSKVPPLIKRVDPQYPQIALAARIQGVVTLEVAIDNQGRVRAAQVISGHPLLNPAAINAVQNWIYEPYRENDQALPVKFRVLVNFRLDGTKGAKPRETERERSLAPENLRVPTARMTLLKRVDPVYPDVALQAAVEGVVVLEIAVDVQGKISDIKVISGHPLLNKAAMDAVWQWEYAPYTEAGKARPAIFTVTVNFTLKNQ